MSSDKQVQVPEEFICRAQEHIEETGEPLLEYRLPSYEHSIGAWWEGDGLVLAAYPVPGRTWRDHAEKVGITQEELGEGFPEALREFMEEHGLTEDDLDEEVDISVAGIGPYDTETGYVCKLLRGMDLSDPAVDVRFVEAMLDYAAVEVRDLLALSCLQYALDEQESGVEIEFHRGERLHY